MQIKKFCANNLIQWQINIHSVTSKENILKTINLKLVVFGIIALTLLTNCGSAKYSTNFKSQKKEIDTLTILTPFIIVTTESNKFNKPDTTLTHSLQSLIEKKAFDLLSAKYSLKTKQLNSSNANSFNKLFRQLEKSDKIITGISCNTILSQINQHFENRFALFITYNGIYNPHFGPHYNMSAGTSTNSVVIAPQAKPNSDMRLMVIDTKIGEIVFYDRIESSNYDPRVESEIEQMLRAILKKIYYK